MQSRTSKLTDQLKAKGTESNVLSGVRVYINGFLAGTTDMEMKRTVQLAGGRILNTPSGASHILTSQGLNLSKVHKHFHGKPRSTVHVVKPEWVSDSIQAGKKLSEWDYQILKDSTRQDVSAMLGQASTH
ncbi:hypothetical protein SISSUDRAFT_1040753 [Sistotremastrum suecicum HHB10207 ss-3]|nr:hypothetical protein SISSUDRAFT_1040753 [Sistotremastrum suecicum HHB10207 ss-3]